MNRIAPNNQLPATHFIEVFRTRHGISSKISADCFDIESIDKILGITKKHKAQTIAIFRIRENKLPTKHNFNETNPTI